MPVYCLYTAFAQSLHRLCTAPLQGNARLADTPAKRAELLTALDAVWNRERIACKDLSALSLGWLAADAVMLAEYRHVHNLTAPPPPGGAGTPSPAAGN